MPRRARASTTSRRPISLPFLAIVATQMLAGRRLDRRRASTSLYPLRVVAAARSARLLPPRLPRASLDVLVGGGRRRRAGVRALDGARAERPTPPSRPRSPTSLHALSPRAAGALAGRARDRLGRDRADRGGARVPRLPRPPPDRRRLRARVAPHLHLARLRRLVGALRRHARSLARRHARRHVLRARCSTAAASSATRSARTRSPTR